MEPLDSAKLVQRSSEISPTGYLTIISILQGVAGAILAERTYQGAKAHTASEPLIWTQSVAVLLLLTIVFHFYTATSVFTRWAPSFMDALLPFCIGGFEVPPAYLVGETVSWPLTVGLFCVVGVLGLGSTALATPESHFAKNPAHAEFIRLLKESAAVLAVVGVSTAACGFLAHAYPAEQIIWGVVAPGAVIAAVIVMALLMEQRLCKIYAFYGVPRSFLW